MSQPSETDGSRKDKLRYEKSAFYRYLHNKGRKLCITHEDSDFDKWLPGYQDSSYHRATNLLCLCVLQKKQKALPWIKTKAPSQQDDKPIYCCCFEKLTGPHTCTYTGFNIVDCPLFLKYFLWIHVLNPTTASQMSDIQNQEHTITYEIAECSGIDIAIETFF